jgi:Immunity protein 63
MNIEIPKPTLEAVETVVWNFAKKINSPSYSLPTYGRLEQSGRPHIEIIGQIYYYVVAERGMENNRKKTTEIEELLHWIFKGVTFSMACDYEVAHRIEGQDFRRLLFQKQIEFLNILDSGWATQMKKEKEQILEKHPFVDK